MKNKFSVDFFSDSQYEYMTAEISYEGQILCQINKDKGNDHMEMEFFNDQRILEVQPKMKFSIDEFFTLVKSVQAELSDM